jgi:hypothetical protein
MYLQGSLQDLFDALYLAGAIQRVLKVDWNPIQTQKQRAPQIHYSLIKQISEIPAHGLLSFVQQLPIELQDALAMEVANEYADFSDRSTIH